MATAHLVFGYLGAGKSTFARRLADDTAALLLSEDEWYLRAYTGGEPTVVLDSTWSERINGLLDDLWPQIVGRGVDVVLDFGFWRRDRRDRARAAAKAVGGSVQLWWVACDEGVARQRLRLRDGAPGFSFLMPGDAYDYLKTRFEPLGGDEEFQPVDTTNPDDDGPRLFD